MSYFLRVIFVHLGIPTTIFNLFLRVNLCENIMSTGCCSGTHIGDAEAEDGRKKRMREMEKADTKLIKTMQVH